MSIVVSEAPDDDDDNDDDEDDYNDYDSQYFYLIRFYESCIHGVGAQLKR